jgi:hypothetical protein
LCSNRRRGAENRSHWCAAGARTGARPAAQLDTDARALAFRRTMRAAQQRASPRTAPSIAQFVPP